MNRVAISAPIANLNCKLPSQAAWNGGDKKFCICPMSAVTLACSKTRLPPEDGWCKGRVKAMLTVDCLGQRLSAHKKQSR